MRGGFFGEATVAAPMDFWELASRWPGGGCVSHLMNNESVIKIVLTKIFNLLSQAMRKAAARLPRCVRGELSRARGPP